MNALRHQAMGFDKQSKEPIIYSDDHNYQSHDPSADCDTSSDNTLKKFSTWMYSGNIILRTCRRVSSLQFRCILPGRRHFCKKYYQSVLLTRLPTIQTLINKTCQFSLQRKYSPDFIAIQHFTISSLILLQKTIMILSTSVRHILLNLCIHSRM